MAVSKEGLELKCEEKKAAINGSWQKEVLGCTPLMLAVISGHLNVVKWLIERAKCDIQVSDWQGNTLIHLAVKYNCKGLVEYFVDKGSVNSFQRNTLGETAASMAKSLELEEISETLSKCKDDSQQKMEELLNLINEEEKREERKKKKAARRNKKHKVEEVKEEENKEDAKKEEEEIKETPAEEVEEPPLEKEPSEIHSVESTEQYTKEPAYETRGCYRGTYYNEYNRRRRDYTRYGRYSNRGRMNYVPRGREYTRYRESRYIPKGTYKEYVEEHIPNTEPMIEQELEKKEEIIQSPEVNPSKEEKTKEEVQDIDSIEDLTAMIRSELQSSIAFSNEEVEAFTPSEIDTEGKQIFSSVGLKIEQQIQTDHITTENIIEELEKDNEIAQKMSFDFAVS